jgi:N-acetylglutamate synthase-like GNAT family acetyltransferase
MYTACFHHRGENEEDDYKRVAEKLGSQSVDKRGNTTRPKMGKLRLRRDITFAVERPPHESIACLLRSVSVTYYQYTDQSSAPTMFTARKEGTLIGLAIVDNFAQFAFLSALAVEPTYQRKRVGSALLHYVEDHLVKHGQECLHLVSPQKSSGFYEKHGYRHAGNTIHAGNGIYSKTLDTRRK